MRRAAVKGTRPCFRNCASVTGHATNIIAGIGGMSEFSMMTQRLPWPLAYGGFVIGMGLIGWTTYVALKHFEKRKLKRA